MEGKHLKVRVFYHDKCFDGACSAALFSRFYHERVRPEAEFQFSGLLHRAGALFTESDFDGHENAIVDFKYSSSPKITWWFDHHQSAFLTPGDAEHFEKQGSERMFYDASFRSCTKLIATVAETRFGFNAEPVRELVHWADVVDGAAYESAEQAVGMAEPAMRLTMVIESNQDPEFIPRLIPLLASRPLAQIIADPLVAPLVEPLLERHRNSVDIMRKHTECVDRTLFFDVTAYDLEGYNKFIPYFLQPNSIYSVGLSKSSFRTKVSVGSNPWTNVDKMVNLAKVCERYGGGGHARVGAISFPPDQHDTARAAAAEIVAELRQFVRANGQ